jgi:hypothetical protein
LAQFISNNIINLFQNGEAYFPAIEAALDRAMHEIYLESYIFEDDTTGRRMAEALRRAALWGLKKAHLLIDGFGSFRLPKTMVDNLEAAGAMVLKFRPKTSPWTLRRRRLRRLHRKIVVVDREIEFVAGPLTRENAEVYSHAEAVSPFIYSDLSAGVLRHLGGLKPIATRSTGFDHIALECCDANNITVCNVPVYGDNTVAEHVFALLLAISHKMSAAVDRTRRRDFSLKGLQGFDLLGKILGVIGTGSIGRCVIEM